MSTLTLRQAFARLRAAVTPQAAGLSALAAAALLVATRAPRPITVRPAADAVSAPVHATSAVAAPSAIAPASTERMPAAHTATAPSSHDSKPATAIWEMANIANPLVDTWVHRFTTSLRGDIAAALDRGSRYVPMVSRKLAEHHMPQELVYLPLIESDYKPTARSPASAVGLWQFMAGTAHTFGLSTRSRADERKDPAKETDAALAYLSELHDRFGSWYLAAAAYNAGPGAVTRAMEHVLGRSTGTDADFYRIARHLPSETRNYVPKLVAAARIGKDPGRFGMGR